MQDTAVASPTSEVQTAIPATQEPVSSAPETATPQGSDAAGAAPSEETFLSGDPNSLPPELQPAYKNMLKDYKQKTQSIADARKKAEYFDKVSSRPDFKDWWNGASRQEKADFKEQKAEVEKSLGQKITDAEFTEAFQTKDGFLNLLAKVAGMQGETSQKEIQELKQKLSVKDAQDIVSSFATELGKDGKPIRSDFDSLDEDQLITGFLNVNPPENHSEVAYRQRLNEAYSWAKNVSQKYYEKGKAEALQIIQKKAASSTEPPTTGAKGAYTGPDPKKITPSEAFQLAKKGIRVPRDD